MFLAMVTKFFASRIWKLHLREKPGRGVGRREVEGLLSSVPFPSHCTCARRQMENSGAGHGTVTCTVKESRGNTTGSFAGRESVARARTCLLSLPPPRLSSPLLTSSPGLSRPFYALSRGILIGPRCVPGTRLA